MASPSRALNENFAYNSMLARALLQLMPVRGKGQIRVVGKGLEVRFEEVGVAPEDPEGFRSRLGGCRGVRSRSEPFGDIWDRFEGFRVVRGGFEWSEEASNGSKRFRSVRHWFEAFGAVSEGSKRFQSV